MSDAHDDGLAVVMHLESARDLRAAQAREQVRKLMTAWAAGRTPGPVGASFQTRLQDALLACSELVSNAHRHGGGLTRFAARIEAGHLLVEADDRSALPPVAHFGERTDPGGFGWALVQTVASETEVRMHAGGSGKTVTVRLPLS
ncbi:ATP-binding protein [Streptomyces sp. NPDC087440]|uniref:ATP-binding protein n=1 Tax=Streptomyces sp. NPDC087440 TaxID=3365790 RepID=UPI00381C5CE0